MNNNRISQKQGVGLLVMFIIGSSSLIVMGLEAKMDMWMAILLALAAASLVMLVYARLLSVLPGKDFFETAEYFLGKVGSKIVIVLLGWFAFDLCAIVLRDFGQFVVTVGLPETPLMVAMLIMVIVCIISARSGIEVVGRWGEQFVIYIIIFMALSILLMTPNMNIDNVFPMLENGILPVARGAFGVLSFPFVETVAFLLVFPAFEKSVSVKKVFLKGLLIGGLIIFASSVADMLVLGGKTAESVYYPTYNAMATIKIGNFVQRFEIIAALIFILVLFLKITILLLGASKAAARLFGFYDYKFIVLPTAFLILCYSLFSFDSMIYFFEWSFKVYPFYAIGFEVIVPIVTLILIEIKLRKKRKKRPSDI